MRDEAELIRRYAEQRSEAAFAELVRRLGENARGEEEQRGEDGRGCTRLVGW